MQQCRKNKLHTQLHRYSAYDRRSCACTHYQRPLEGKFRRQGKAQTRAQLKEDEDTPHLWGTCSRPIFTLASIDIRVSGRFAVEAGIDSWVVIPLIPHKAFPFHLPSLDIDPAADETVVSLYQNGSRCSVLSSRKEKQQL